MALKLDISVLKKLHLGKLTQPLKQLFGKVHVAVLAILIVGLYVYLLLQVGKFANAEPTQDQITESIVTIKQVKIKPEDIARLESLRETNVEVKAIFDQTRDNPFTDKK